MYLSRILLCCCCSLLGLVAGIRAQTAQEIVAKYLQAMGGKERLQSINSIYLEGIAVLDNGSQLTSRAWKVYDRLYRQEVTSAAGKLIVLVTPRQGWSSGPGTGGVFKPLTNEQFNSLRPEIDPGGPLLDYNAKGNKVDLAGMDTVDGHPCYRLKVSFPTGNSAMYSIDAKTWYLLRASHRGGSVMGSIVPGNGANDNAGVHPDGVVTMDYGDYKIVPGGYIFPYSITYSPYGAKVTMQKIQVNSSVDEETLSRPK
jgi:hypothetical protein